MKASLIILTGASTVSATWFPNWCCGGFPSPDQPQTTTTATTTTTTTTAATNIPAPTSTELGLDGIYPASSIDREPTTLSTSIVATKSADAGSIPIDEGLALVIDPTTDVETTVYPTEAPENAYAESFHFSDDEELDDLPDSDVDSYKGGLADLLRSDSDVESYKGLADLLRSDSDVESYIGLADLLRSDSDSDSDVDSDSDSKQIAGETDPITKEARIKYGIVIQQLKATLARLKGLAEKPQKLQAAEDVPNNSEVGDEISNEKGFIFPTLPQATDPDATTPRIGNGDSASSQIFGKDSDDASGSKYTEDQDKR